MKNKPDSTRNQDYDHHREYRKALDAITSGAEKLLQVCGEDDGVMPNNEDGPYVKMSPSMFALRMAANLYWHTAPDANDVFDDADDDNGEDDDDLGVMFFGANTLEVSLPGEDDMIDVTGNVQAGDKITDAIIRNMSSGERLKLIERLRTLDKQKPASMPPE